eukprot:2864918-Heterocapsa_arctica.AAC.1
MKGIGRPPFQPVALGENPVPYDAVVANPGIPYLSGKVQEHRECVIWNHAGMQAYAEFVVEIQSQPSI